jgi:hypothetical protein
MPAIFSDLLAADNSKAKQVIQAAAVNTDRNNLGPIRIASSVSPGSIPRFQCLAPAQPFDRSPIPISILRCCEAQRRNSSSPVSLAVWNSSFSRSIVMLRSRFGVTIHQLDGSLHWSVRPSRYRPGIHRAPAASRPALAVPDIPRLIQFCLEHAGRRPFGLRGNEYQEPFLLRDQPAAKLADNPVSIGVAGNDVQLVNQNASRLNARQNLRVERLDL